MNINRGAGSTHIDGLRRFVVENHLDVGFAYDGDADRCLAVDENGEVVDGDKIIYILGCQMESAKASWRAHGRSHRDEQFRSV